MIELPVDLDPYSQAYDVNDSGQAVGSRHVDDGGITPKRSLAVFWDAGAETAIDLADLSDRYSRAAGINNAGMIVGKVVNSIGTDEQGDPIFTNHAMLWSSLLTTVGAIELPIPSGFDSGSAESVNDEGLVVGTVTNLKSSAIAVVLWHIDSSGAVTTTVVDEGSRVSGLANSAVGETARLVGYERRKRRGQTQFVALMWEFVP